MRLTISALLVLLLFVPVCFLSVPVFSQDKTPTPEAFTQTVAPPEKQEHVSEFSQFTNISVACPVAAPPYYYVDDARKAQGLIIDIWCLWAEKTDIDVTFVPAEGPDLLNSLGQAIFQGDVMLLKQVIDAIRPHNAAVSEMVGELVQDFKYQDIWAMIQQIKKESEEGGESWTSEESS